MRLLRWGEKGQERPGLLDSSGQIRDLSAHFRDLGGEILSPRGLDRIRGLTVDDLPIVSPPPRLGPCVARVPNFICVGLNYSDHAAETGAEIPKEPILFNKHTSAICGPNDNIIQPKNSKKLDWEVELGIVIGSVCRYVKESESIAHIAGYCVVNDVSERHFQIERGGQWTKGKSAESFAPIGPWLVTTDEIKDPQNLFLSLDVNGTRYQNGSTATMIFGVSYLISYISQFMTLVPGDIIATGTPPGVGLGQKPNVFLKPGDNMRLSVTGLGEQNQRVVGYTA